MYTLANCKLCNLNNFDKIDYVIQFQTKFVLKIEIH